MKLEGKVIVVTGAGQVIGRAIAERYAAEGAKVAVVDIAGDNARSVAEGIGKSAIAIEADVSDAADVDRILAETLNAFGALNVMHNNAAITHGAVKHVLETDEAWWDTIIGVNLKGSFLCALAAAKHMANHGGGVIINTSSGGATRAHRGMVAYDAAKGGIEALTRALALDLAPYGIRVVGLVPGLIVPEGAPPERVALTAATVPLGRAGRAEDLAGPAVFLASDDAAYVTGSFVTVDGGVLFQQRSPQIETFPVEGFPVMGSSSTA